MAGDRRPARADRRLPAQRELLAGRPDRPVRPVQRALPRPRAGLRQGRRPPRRRERALPGVLEPRVHAVRAEPGQHADAAAGAEHRHRARPQPARGDPAGRHQVFDTDQFVPLIGLGEQLSRQARGHAAPEVDRALRVLADHTRGMSFLIADGVVPSNEDRGYVLRRLMRRAIVQGRRIGIEPGFLPRYARGRARDDGHALPASCSSRPTPSTCGCAPRRRRSTARSSPGLKMLDDVIAQRDRERRGGHRRRRGLQAARHVRLPVRSHARAGRRARPRRRRAGLRVPDGGAARAGARVAPAARAGRTRARSCARSRPRRARRRVFTGYETTEQATAVAA